MKVQCDFVPGAVPGEREAIEAGDFPFHVHGVIVDKVGETMAGYEITIEGPRERVMHLLRSQQYEDDQYTILED